MRNRVAANSEKNEVALLHFVKQDLFTGVVHIVGRSPGFFIVNFLVQKIGETAAVDAGFLTTTIFVGNAIPIVNEKKKFVVLNFFFRHT